MDLWITAKKYLRQRTEPEIKEQIDAWIDDICTGLVTLCCIFNPFRIILGGGIMAQGVCAFGGKPEGESADRTGTSDRGDRSCKACKHGGHDGSGQPCGKVTCAVR